MSVRDNILNDKYESNLPYPNFGKRDEGWTRESVTEARRNHIQDVKRLTNQFKQDLFEEFDVQNNPKAELLFSKAWELGHSAGLYEVLGHFENLVDLIL